MGLTSSQKVNLVKQVAYQLSNDTWKEIRLTLAQFAIAAPESKGADKYDFLLDVLPKADEKKLAELGEHFGVSFSPQNTSPSSEAKFWRPNCFRLFVSHLSAHQKSAGKLQDALGVYGITCFVAHKDVEPTTEWQSEIEKALRTADALVALLHPSFHESKWTDQEIGFAMGRDIAIFAIRLGETPYGFIGKFQAFNGKDKTAEQMSLELFEMLLKHKRTQRQMADVLVALFEKTASFADAKKWISYLEQLEIWDVSYSSRIATAAENNSQISDSWGVPGRVEKLVKQWKSSGVG